VIARTKFLERNPDLIRRFIAGHLDVLEWMNQNQDETRRIIGERIEKLTKKAIPEDVLKDALSRTDFTHDPLNETVLTFAGWARELGFQRESREALTDLFDLSFLNEEVRKRKMESAQ
jgi:NitT/TauT family transport system substrate-binding protein